MRTTLPLRRQPSGRKKCLICALALFLSLAGYAGAGFWGYDPGGLLHRLGWRPHQIGDVIDSFNGVAVYYNGPVNNVSGRNLSPDGYNLGQKQQCVEFV